MPLAGFHAVASLCLTGKYAFRAEGRAAIIFAHAACQSGGQWCAEQAGENQDPLNFYLHNAVAQFGINRDAISKMKAGQDSNAPDATNESDVVLVYTTHPSLVEAEKNGRKLVEAGLAACVNILPAMRSIYRWKGAIETADEVVMIVKTRVSLAERVTAAVCAEHSYETPAVLVLPVDGGNQSFIDWILAETSEATGRK